jgi:hypothetical protein
MNSCALNTLRNAHAQQAVLTINSNYSYQAYKQMIMFRKHINRLLFIVNALFFARNCQNAIIKVVFLVCDVRCQHVGEMGAQYDR